MSKVALYASSFLTLPAISLAGEAVYPLKVSENRRYFVSAQKSWD